MIHQIPRLIKIHDQIVGNGLHYWDTPAKCVNFAASLQVSDITKDLMYNVNNPIEYPFRGKVNIRRIDKEYCQKGVAEGRTITYRPVHRIEFTDPVISDEILLYDILKSVNTVDIPLWFAKKSGDLDSIPLGHALKKWNIQMIYQYKGCNINCRYCYVSDMDNSATQGYFANLTPRDIFDSYRFYNELGKVQGIRCSGGEPSIYLDHIHHVIRVFKEENYPVIIQLDTNGSTFHYIEHMLKHDPNWDDVMIRELAEKTMIFFAFKGTDDKTIQEITNSNLTLDDQFNTLEFYISNGFDVYLHLYCPNPVTLPSFIKRLDEDYGSNAVRKLRCYPLELYTPTKQRLERNAKHKDMFFRRHPEQYATGIGMKWMLDFQASTRYLKRICREEYGFKYPEVMRCNYEIGTGDCKCM
jgi:uncharacterized Fe-S cluster-containing radical SAM superfamily protein